MMIKKVNTKKRMQNNFSLIFLADLFFISRKN
jgi:hypothetical protein